MHNQFTEEMLRQMYQRRGYQVMSLCGEVTADRQKVLELTFQAFGEAWRRLCAEEQPADVARQDEVLLECTRQLICRQTEEICPAEAEQAPCEACNAQTCPPDLPPLGELLEAEPQPMQQEPAPLPFAAEVADEAPLPQMPAAPVLQGFGDTAQPEEEALDLTDTSGSNVGWVLLVILLVLIIVGLLWAIWGVAQNILPLPKLDLGYQWFNTNVFPLF